MKATAIATCIVGILLAILSRPSAHAAPMFCNTWTSYVTPRVAHAVSDDTYFALFGGSDSSDVTRIRLAVLDGKREYEVEAALTDKVPVRDADQRTTEAVRYRPVELHFAKPVSIDAVWIESTLDANGQESACLANPAVPAQPAPNRELAKVLADLDSQARHNATTLEVSTDAGIPYITPENCAKKYVDASAPHPITPTLSRIIWEGIDGRIQTLVRVDLAPTGELLSTSLVRTSGNSWADKATLDAAKKTIYLPKKVDCIPFAGSYLFRATFDPNE